MSRLGPVSGTGIMLAAFLTGCAAPEIQDGTVEESDEVLKVEPPPARAAGIKVPDVATLVNKLHTEAKVI